MVSAIPSAFSRAAIGRDLFVNFALKIHPHYSHRHVFDGATK